MIFFLEHMIVLLSWIGLYLIIDSLNPSMIPVIFGIMWMTVFYGLAVIVKRRVRKLWQIFVAHIGIMILLWVTWFFGLYINFCSEAAAISFLSVLINMFLNINDWRNRYPESFYEMQPLFAVCPAAMYVYGIINKDDNLLFRGLVIMILIIVIHFVCTYLQGTSTFFISNKEIEELPEKAIKNTNAKMVTVLIVCAVFVMMMAGLFRFDGMLAGIGLIMVRLALWIVYYIDKLVSMLFFETPDMEKTAPPALMSELEGAEDSDPFINKLVAIVGITALVIVIIRLVISFFRRRDPDYYKNTVEIINKDWVEVREDIRAEEKTSEKYPNDEKGRIRRRYKKEVKRKMSDKVNTSMTTGQILSETDKNGNNETIRELTPLYNKVRYDR